MGLFRSGMTPRQNVCSVGVFQMISVYLLVYDCCLLKTEVGCLSRTVHCFLFCLRSAF